MVVALTRKAAVAPMLRVRLVGWRVMAGWANPNTVALNQINNGARARSKRVGVPRLAGADRVVFMVLRKSELAAKSSGEFILQFWACFEKSNTENINRATGQLASITRKKRFVSAEGAVPVASISSFVARKLLVPVEKLTRVHGPLTGFSVDSTP